MSIFRDGPIEKNLDEKGKLRAFTRNRKSGKKNEETLIDDVMSTDSAEALELSLFRSVVVFCLSCPLEARDHQIVTRNESVKGPYRF